MSSTTRTAYARGTETMDVIAVSESTGACRITVSGSRRETVKYPQASYDAMCAKLDELHAEARRDGFRVDHAEDANGVRHPAAGLR